MGATLDTRAEWEALSDAGALLVVASAVVIGSVWALLSAEPAMQFHGVLLATAALIGGLAILLNLKTVTPQTEETAYFDGPIKVATIAAIVWGIAGFLVGDIIAWQLALPKLNLDLPWFSFGRLRPLHTSAVIFAFGGNVLIATSLYVVQRTCHARLAGRWSPWFVVWGYQLFIAMAGTGYLLGVSQGKEYAEPEWYADVLLTVVWVAYLLIFLGTLTRRKEPHIYVANWFYLAFIVTVAMLHLVNNAGIPVSLTGTKSYIVYAGVQDAMTQWWYGHNAVGFFLTAGFLGIMYYFIPKRVERPVYSYRLSIVHFWTLIFLYIWAGPHHLHYTALPDWAQTLGMAFSIMLWMPSWGGMINGLMTLGRCVGQTSHRSGRAPARRVRRLLRHVDVRRPADVDQSGQLLSATTLTGPSVTCIPARSVGSPWFPLVPSIVWCHGCGAAEVCTRSNSSSGTSGSPPSASCFTSQRCGCRASRKA